LKDEDDVAFYVGKGTGSRAIQHIVSDGPSDTRARGEVLNRIRDEGRPVRIHIESWHHTEHDAYARELELIGQLGTLRHGTGDLLNISVNAPTPAVGEYERIITPMPRDLVARIDQYRFENGIPSRSEAIRQLLWAATAAWKAGIAFAERGGVEPADG
jgi:hypothetical protein